MLAYTCIGVNDKEKALPFYDAVFAELGGKRVFNNDRLQFWSNGQGPMIAVGSPYDGEAAHSGNGIMPALAAPDRETVDKVYAAALAAGGSCDGEPGERMPTFYGAYFRDPEGNKMCVCKFG